MFTLAKLLAAEVLTAWQLPGDELPQRVCYTTSRWKLDVQSLEANALPSGMRRFVASPSDEIEVCSTISGAACPPFG